MTTSVAPDRATSTSRPLAEADPEVAALVAAERDRQARKIRLIPSENYSSLAVRQTLASVFANKYAEGYPGRRYYEGQQNVDRVETLAIERARAVFGYDHANVQPYAGSGANLAVYAAFCEPGDTVMGMALPMGGHLTHGHGVSVTGKWFTAVQYGVRRETGLIDMDQVRDLAREHRPKLIFCGGTAIPRTIDFAAFAEVAREVDAVLVADMAHISGLIAGGAHPSPLGHAPVMTTSTHKALRGPRGGMVACDEAHAKAVDRAVFPGLQGGPHEHVIAALAVALREAGEDAFAAYAHAVVENARALGEALAERGHDLVSGGDRQPPVARRLHRDRGPRQGGGAGARPRRARGELQHGAIRHPQTVRPLGPAARHARRDHAWHGHAGDARGRGLDRRRRAGGEGR